MTCGCGRFFDDHGNIANLVAPDFQAAAVAAQIPLSKVVANTTESLRMLASTKSPHDAALSQLLQPAIVFDIDNVLAFWSLALINALNVEFGTQYTENTLQSMQFTDLFSVPKVNFINKLLQSKSFYQSIAPDFRGIDVVHLARDAGFEIVISSDRPAKLKEATLAWLQKWDVPYHHIVLHGSSSKKEALAQYGVNNPAILIDDDPAKGTPRSAAYLVRPGITILSPRCPWTPSGYAKQRGVTVFDSWDTVLEQIGIA